MIPGLYGCFQHWAWFGTVWVYSDPHFDDPDCKLMNPDWITPEEQIEILNSKVGRKDALILLGDIGNPKYLKQIRNCYRKILITGNHDTGVSNYREYFDEIYDGPLMIGPKLLLSHEPANVPWAFNIHGHTHNGEMEYPGALCVCADVCGFTPVNLNRFIRSGRLGEVESLHRITINNAAAENKFKEKTIE